MSIFSGLEFLILLVFDYQTLGCLSSEFSLNLFIVHLDCYLLSAVKVDPRFE